MLATRLRDLEKAGVVAKRTLPPPGAAKVYELTELGGQLRPAVTELARWGLRLLGDVGPTQSFQSHWLAMPLRVMFRPERAEGVSLTVRFVIDGDELAIQIADGNLTVLHAVAGEPDVVIVTDPLTVADLGRASTAENRANQEKAIADGRLDITGDRHSRALLSYVLGITDRQPARLTPGV